MITTTNLERLYRRATIAHAKSGLPDETRAEIDRLWVEIHSGFDVTVDANFGPFLGKFIAKRHRETPSNERASKLCNSGNHVCNVLHGEIPVWFERRQSRFDPDDPITPDDARRYIRRHPKCHAVRDALEAWDHDLQETKRKLQRIITLGMGATRPDIDLDNVPGASSGDTPTSGPTAEAEMEAGQASGQEGVATRPDGDD